MKMSEIVLNTFALLPLWDSRWAMSVAVTNMGVNVRSDGESMAMYLYASRLSAAFRCFPKLNAPPSPSFSEDDIPLEEVSQPGTSGGGRCHRRCCCHRTHHRHKHKVSLFFLIGWFQCKVTRSLEFIICKRQLWAYYILVSLSFGDLILMERSQGSKDAELYPTRCLLLMCRGWDLNLF